MSSLLSVTELRQRFDIDTDVEPDRLEPHIQAAERRLRKWVGDTQFEAAVALTGNETDDHALVTDLKNAQAHLAFHFMIYGLNYPFTSKGIVATVMSGEGKEMRKFLTPAETQAVAVQMLELAREIAEPYMLLDGTPTGSFEVVSDGEC